MLRELLSFKTTLEALFITCFVESYYFLFSYFSLHFCAACVESSILPCYEKNILAAAAATANYILPLLLHECCWITGQLLEPPLSFVCAPIYRQEEMVDE